MLYLLALSRDVRGLLRDQSRLAQLSSSAGMSVIFTIIAPGPGTDELRLRVWERGAGETLACGTGACAAVAVGIRLGLLDAKVDVATRGGALTIEWQGNGTPVLMTGPAETVYEGEIDL